MVFIPGGSFRMGSDKHYPEEAPAHQAAVGDFWIDRTPITNKQFRKFVRETGHVTFAEIPPMRRIIPARCPHAQSRFAGFHAAEAAGRSCRLVAMVDVQIRRQLAPAIRPAQFYQRTRRSSCRPYRLSRCGSLRRWAGKELPSEAEWEFAARGGLEGAEFAWGDAFTPGGKHMANTWQGDFPHQKRQRRTRAHVAGHGFPAERLRPVRHDRQRLGMDHGLVRLRARRRRRPSLLCSAKSARLRARDDQRRDQLRPAATRHQNSTQSAQRRLAPVRAELLPPLPPCCTPCAAGRYVHEFTSDSDVLSEPGASNVHRRRGRQVRLRRPRIQSPQHPSWQHNARGCLGARCGGAGDVGASAAAAIGPAAEHRLHHGRRHRLVQYRRLSPAASWPAGRRTSTSWPPRACCSPITMPRRAARRAGRTSSPANCPSAPA